MGPGDAVRPDRRRKVTGRVLIRPSRVGKAILLVTVLLTIFAIQSPVLIGPIVTLIVLGLADGSLAWWRLRRTRVDIVPLRSVAGLPELLSCSVAVSGCAAPLAVALLADQRVAGRVLVEPGSAPLQASFLYPRPHRRNYIDYRIAISTVGLALARRDELVVLDSGLFQGPPVADIGELDPPTAHVEPELERLREYVPGDRWSRISWTTLARTGSLHVRQEDPIVAELVVAVDLTPVVGSGSTAPVDVATQLTRTLSLAAAVVTDGLSRDAPVRLVTYEPPPAVFDVELAIASRRIDGRRPKPEIAAARATGSVVSELVPDITEMNRRLAMVDVGPIDPEPPAPRVQVTRRGVSFIR